MEEKNKKILDQAIRQLKGYQAPERGWDDIELELEKEHALEQLESGLNDLPRYKAPDSIWNQIENELEVPVEQKQAVLRFIPWRKIAVAAAIVGIVLTGLDWLTNSNEESVFYSYSKETVDDQLENRDWNEEEEAYDMVKEFCKIQQLVCEEPEFKNLRGELEELNEAREILVMAMETYGSDAEIIAQLTEVELERSNVLKKIIERI